MNKFAIGCGAVILVILLVLVVAAVAVMGSYNRLVGLQQNVDAKWAQVQKVYQRRADIIPNLVKTVAGAAKFETYPLIWETNATAYIGTATGTPAPAATPSP